MTCTACRGTGLAQNDTALCAACDGSGGQSPPADRDPEMPPTVAPTETPAPAAASQPGPAVGTDGAPFS